MTWPLLLLIGIVTGHLVAQVTGRELWPFSSYPMFSRRRRIADVEACCLVLIWRSGAREVWRPRAYTWAKEFDNRGRAALGRMRVDPAQGQAMLRALVGQALAVVLGEPTAEPLGGVQVIRRRVRPNAARTAFVVIDEQLPVGGLDLLVARTSHPQAP